MLPLSTEARSRDDGRTAAEDHREPLWRAQPARDARLARRRPRSAVVGRRDGDPRADVARAEGARRAGDGRARARLCAQRHRFHRQRAPCDRDRRRDGRRDLARPRLAAERAGGCGGISAAAIARTSAITTTSRMRSIASGSIRGSSTRARTSRADGDTLDDAQAAKLDHICRKLRLAPGERFLDIGCGWGALLIHRRGALRRRGDGHHAVAEPVRLRRASRSPRAGSKAA